MRFRNARLDINVAEKRPRSLVSATHSKSSLPQSQGITSASSAAISTLGLRLPLTIAPAALGAFALN
jgi:hypothetical protein